MAKHSLSIIQHEALNDAIKIEEIGFPSLFDLILKYQKIVAYSHTEEKLPVNQKFSINHTDASSKSSIPNIITFADGSNV